MAVFSQQEAMQEAIEAYLQFEGLEVELRSLKNLAELKDCEQLEALLILDQLSNRSALELAVKVRQGEAFPFVPILLSLQKVDAYGKARCFDLEYVLPCEFPPQSKELIPGLQKVLQFSRKRARILALREQIQKHLKAKEWAVAQTELAQFRKLSKDEFRSQLLAAKIALGQKQYKEAVQSCMDAIHLHKNSLEARLLLADIYKTAGYRDRAEEVIKKSLSLTPMHIPFQRALADLAIERDDWEAALNIYRESLKLDALQDELKVDFIFASLYTGHQKEAQELAKTVKRPKELGRDLQLKVIELAQRKDVEQAKKALDSCLKLFPTLEGVYKVWMNIGLLAKKSNRVAEAIECFQKAQESAPKGYLKAKEQLTAMKQAS